MKNPLLKIMVVVIVVIGIATSFYFKHAATSTSVSTEAMPTVANTKVAPAETTSLSATAPAQTTSLIAPDTSSQTESTTTPSIIKKTASTSIKHHVEKQHHHAVEKNIHSTVTGINVNKLMTVASSDGLQPRVLKSALNAYEWALQNRKLGSNRGTLTVVDFTLPSYEKRMWVLDLRDNKVLMRLYTTQGSGSGYIFATRFSNVGHSEASSLGIFTTSDEYYGKHGMSMRLNGLQYGINNNARNREIVVHDAAYASAAYIRANHRAGHSWGCFAVDPAQKQALLNNIKGGSAFFAYARQIEKTSVVSHGPFSI